MASIASASEVTDPRPLTQPDREGGRAKRIVRLVGYVAASLALVTASVTFIVLSGLAPIDVTREVVDYSLAINGFVVLVLVAAIAWEAGSLWRARRRGVAAARLHIRIVALFCIIAATPAILIAAGATITLNERTASLFQQQRALVADAANVSAAMEGLIVEEINADLMDIKAFVEAGAGAFVSDPALFDQRFSAIPTEAGVDGVYIVDNTGAPVASANDRPMEALRDDVLAQAAAQPNQPIAIRWGPSAPTSARGIVALENYPDGFLSISREIDPSIIAFMDQSDSYGARLAAQELLVRDSQMAWGLLYLGVTLIVVLVASWLGLGFANRLVAPIRRLVAAADGVASGDLDIAVPVRRADGDIGVLGSSFNIMAGRLRTQRDDLIAASDQIDSRRRFIEAVLSGISAGVVGLDAEGRINVINRMGLRLLGIHPDEAIGEPIADLVPELGPVMAAAWGDNRSEHRDQISVARGGQTRVVNVRVSTDVMSAEKRGYVITLDDITDLVTAQRSSAWADIARRIAHEIKNPLTPIQLSAERLRRRFSKVITEDREVFDQCTDTIIRQVGDIGRMVDEFSAFARMPKPVLERRDLRDPIRDAVLLMQVGYPDIAITHTAPSEALWGRFDGRMISQVLTNLIKNAAEAIAAVHEPTEPGRIEVAAYSSDGQLVVSVTDNGIGLPSHNRMRLLEPYMTTREKGTGLGLAIVRKIVEEHAGAIELLDAPAVAAGGHGAMVRLTFPVLGAAETPTPEIAAAE